MNLFYEPKDRLRLTHDDRSYHTVVPRWSSPLRHPGAFLALLDGKGNEIVTLKNPRDLPDGSYSVVMEEISRRYLTADVLEILQVKNEWGTTYWTVRTDRGVREFVTQSLQENAQWLSPTHIMLIDVDGNRFELRDTAALEAPSRKLLGTIL